VDPLVELQFSGGQLVIPKLIPGHPYSLNVHLYNDSVFNILAGELILSMKHIDSGVEIFRKEIKNINLSGKERKDLNETLIFNRALQIRDIL